MTLRLSYKYNSISKIIGQLGFRTRTLIRHSVVMKERARYLSSSPGNKSRKIKSHNFYSPNKNIRATCSTAKEFARSKDTRIGCVRPMSGQEDVLEPINLSAGRQIIISIMTAVTILFKLQHFYVNMFTNFLAQI